MTANWRLRFVAPILILGMVLLVWPQRLAASTDFSYATEVSYQVNLDGSTSVEEHYRITNNTPRLYLSQIQLSTPTADVTEASASYDEGGGLPVSATQQSSEKAGGYNYQRLTIGFPKQIYGQGKTWGFTLHYNTKGLVDSKGGSHTVYIPQIDPADGTDSYQVRVEVPDSFGGAHFAGAKSASTGNVGGRQFYTFGKDELTKHSLALAFGDVNRYKLNFNFPLKNDSPFSRTLTVVLPPNLNNQKVYLNQLNPAPNGTRLDSDGNILADYTVGAHQSLTVTTDVVGEVAYRSYDLSKSGKQSDIPADLVRKYTSATHYWQQTADIKRAAASVSDRNKPVADNVKAMYQYVINRLSYNNDKIAFNIRQGSALAYSNPDNAVCLEYADLLVSMLRSQGIPARMPVGYGYSGNLKQSAAVADSLHSWVEAYVPGVGWMTLDPTWGEKFDQFGQSDLDHFAFSVWGADDSRPDAVMAGSTDLGYQYEQAQLSYIYKASAASNGARISATRYPLLPGVSVDYVVAHGQSQSVTDTAIAMVGMSQIDLGRLAPSQISRRFHWDFGGGWLSTPSLQLNAGTNAIARGKAKVNYIGMVIAAALIIVAILVVRARHRRRKHPAQPMHHRAEPPTEP
jgi:hypothetical protein